MFAVATRYRPIETGSGEFCKFCIPNRRTNRVATTITCGVGGRLPVGIRQKKTKKKQTITVRKRKCHRRNYNLVEKMSAGHRRPLPFACFVGSLRDFDRTSNRPQGIVGRYKNNLPADNTSTTTPNITKLWVAITFLVCGIGLRNV